MPEGPDQTCETQPDQICPTASVNHSQIPSVQEVERRGSSQCSGMILLMLIALCALSENSEGARICYKRLGCFSDHKPWSQIPSRRLIPLPWSPEQIGTRFLLLTRDNPKHYQEISASRMRSIRNSTFKPTRRTIFIAHGLADQAEGGWVSELIQEILQVEDVNGIGVDWHAGAGNLSLYAQATSNSRVVGREIAYFIKRLQEEMEYPPSMVHIIGHSLGAHVAGEAGRRFPGIWRITGLDPARPYFEGTPDVVHLDASDADFVDIIHTDTDPLLGLGMMKATGHYDFYPNGGRHMTGCPNKLSFLTSELSVVESVACNHMRAPLYYSESVRNPAGFRSYPCESYQSFLEGACFPCSPTRCPTMGHYAELLHGASTLPLSLYLHTGGDLPHFSSHRYRLSISLVGNQKLSGTVFISLFSNEHTTPDYDIITGMLLPGKVYSRFIDSHMKFGDISCADIHWAPSLSHISVFPMHLGADRVDVQSGDDGAIYSFCSSGTVRGNTVQTLGPCRSPASKSKRRATWM